MPVVGFVSVCIRHPHAARQREPRAASPWASRSINRLSRWSVVEKLKNRGVIFQGPIRDDGGLLLAFFTDPDGNPLYLAETGSGG